jgi:hypothetical protein
MSLSRQHLQHVLRSLLGGAAVYALLLQIMLAALAGAPAGLDVASALCASDHAISAEQPDQPSAPIHHDCFCPGLCHANFTAPHAQAMRVVRVATPIAYAQFDQSREARALRLAFSARGPPLSA